MQRSQLHSCNSHYAVCACARLKGDAEFWGSERCISSAGKDNVGLPALAAMRAPPVHHACMQVQARQEERERKLLEKHESDRRQVDTRMLQAGLLQADIDKLKQQVGGRCAVCFSLDRLQAHVWSPNFVITTARPGQLPLAVWIAVWIGHCTNDFLP